MIIKATKITSSNDIGKIFYCPGEISRFPDLPRESFLSTVTLEIDKSRRVAATLRGVTTPLLSTPRVRNDHRLAPPDAHVHTPTHPRTYTYVASVFAANANFRFLATIGKYRVFGCSPRYVIINAYWHACFLEHTIDRVCLSVCLFPRARMFSQRQDSVIQRFRPSLVLPFSRRDALNNAMIKLERMHRRRGSGKFHVDRGNAARWCISDRYIPVG